MLPHPPLLAALPRTVLDMTADFTPLFVGLVLIICFGVLALAVAIGVHDTYWLQPQVTHPEIQSESAPDCLDAA